MVERFFLKQGQIIQAMNIHREYKNLHKIGNSKSIPIDEKQLKAAQSMKKIQVSKENLELLQNSRSAIDYLMKKREQKALETTKQLFQHHDKEAEEKLQDEAQKLLQSLIPDEDDHMHRRKQKRKGL